MEEEKKMKKNYQKPVVDKIDFCYRDQVVAASGGPSGGQCTVVYKNNSTLGCDRDYVYGDQV